MTIYESNYFDHATFEHIYLEDSYVTGIRLNHSKFEFYMLLVLLETHPSYTEPIPGERYCYEHGILQISGITKMNLKRLTLSPTINIDGTVDFGNIDYMRIENERVWIHGEWGEFEATSKLIEVTISS